MADRVVALGAVVHAAPRVDGSPAEGVHVVWIGPGPWRYSLEGFTVLRRPARRVNPDSCEVIVGDRMTRLRDEHVLSLAFGVARFGPAPCPEALRPLPREADAEDAVATDLDGIDKLDDPEFRLAVAHITGARASTKDCQRYRVDFHDQQDVVAVQAVPGPMLATAFRGSKAIDARLVAATGGSAVARFVHPGMDRIDVYARDVRSLEICVPGAKQEEAGSWDDAVVLGQVQLPVATHDPSLAPSDEFPIALSRMLDPDELDADEFEQLAGLLRDLPASPSGRPIDRVLQQRDSEGRDLHEYGLLELALLPTLHADGRRMLGFSWLDTFDLTPGSAYDYRVIGVYPEIDLHDRVLDFGRVPAGTPLPAVFHLAEVLVQFAGPPTVTVHPPLGFDDVRGVGRRGIRMADGTATGRVCFDMGAAVQELTIELDADGNEGLEYEAFPASYLPLAGGAFGDTVPPGPHAVLRFPVPVDRVELRGSAFLHGLRLHGITGPARDPKRLVHGAVDVLGVRYEPTAPPAAPTSVSVVNMQEPLVPRPAVDAAADPPQQLGFRIRWRAPIAGGSPVWPPDAEAPPFAAAGFVVERRQVDGPGVWQAAGPRVVYGDRTRPQPNQSLDPGVDLVAFFAERGRRAGADDFFMFDDPIRVDPFDGPAPGSWWQYRVAALDITGRRSDWTVSPVVRLEKRRPPPPPAPLRAHDTTGLGETGIEARVLDRLDPDVVPADLAHIPPGKDHAVFVEWAWTSTEREADPWAREFRIYVQPRPPDILEGTITGPVTDAGPHWSAPAIVDRGIGTDALASVRLRSNGSSFRILSNTAGTAVTLLLEKVKKTPALAPASGSFRLSLDPGAAGMRSPAFERRVGLEPIDGRTVYEAVLTDVFAVSPARPLHTAWIGVTAADDESYIPDAFTVPYGGEARPGNESAVAVKSVALVHRGRPSLVAPVPLDNVPERVTDEPAEGPVRVALPLPDLVRPPPPPAAPLVPGEAIVLERLALSAVISRLRVDGGSIRVALPDDNSATYLPEHPDDRAKILEQVGSGEPARVDARFVRAVLARHATLGQLFQRVGSVIPFGLAEDDLPPTADRWVYRVRRVDAAHRVSDGAVMLDATIRVPSLRAPAPPSVTVGATVDDRVRAAIRVRVALDLAWVLVFSEVSTTGSATDPRPVELIRLANRRDLYPSNGIRLRTPAGLLTPGVLSVADGTADGAFVNLEFDEAVGYERRARLWAVAVTRDGVPSVPAGPVVARTAAAPLTPPTPVVARVNDEVQVDWATPTRTGVEVRVERRGGEGTWAPVSPWLTPPDAAASPTTYWEEPVPPQTSVSYRLRLRTTDGREAVSPAADLPPPGP